MKLPKFKILTEKSILDIPYITDEQHERDCLALIEEQDKILEQHMYHRNSTECYLLHMFDSVFFDECHLMLTLDEAINGLAIKEGTDLVQFENGTIGFVAYYNTRCNGFEIIRDRYV